MNFNVPSFFRVRVPLPLRPDPPSRQFIGALWKVRAVLTSQSPLSNGSNALPGWHRTATAFSGYLESERNLPSIPILLFDIKLPQLFIQMQRLSHSMITDNVTKMLAHHLKEQWNQQPNHFES